MQGAEWDAFRCECLAAGLAPRTIECYVGALSRAERWVSERGWSLADLTAPQLASYADTLPRTWSTRAQLRAALRRYWTSVGRSDGPAFAVRCPRKRRYRSLALEPSEAASLAAEARLRADAPGLAVLCGLYLGLRRFEIAGLRWECFKDGWVRIVGKGDIEAELPVHPVLAGALEDHPRTTAPWVFPSAGGDHVCPATVWNWCRRVAVAAGLGPIQPHRLRHTALTWANEATGDLRAVQEFARHARPETTALYTRVSTRRLLLVSGALNYLEEPCP